MVKNSIQRLLESKYSKDFIYFSVGYMFCALLSLITTAIINKTLDRDSLGEYSYIKSLFDLVISVTSLGIYAAYLRFNTFGVNKSVSRFVLRYIIFATAITYIIFIFISKKYIASLYVLILFFNERTYYYRSIMKTETLNFLRLGAALITLLLIVLMFFYLPNQLSAYSIIFTYALGYFICLPFFLKKNDVEFNSIVISVGTIFKYSVPGALLTVIDWTFVFYSQHIIKENYGYFELAPYSIAQRALLCVKLFTGLYLMFYPTIYFREIERRNYKIVVKSRRLILLSLIFVVIICSIFASQIYCVMGASSYICNIEYFRLLIWADFFKVAASLYGLYLTYKIKTYQNLMIMSCGMIVDIVLLTLFVNTNGIISACYATIVSYMIVLLLMLYFSYKKERKELSNYGFN